MFFQSLNDPIPSLLVAVIFAWFVLGAILLILGAGGGFSQMLKSVHLDTIVVDHAAHRASRPPLLVAHPGVSPELMALATASGAVMLSHVDDSGFWLFKEYFRLSVAQTRRTWTLMLSLQSLIGLAGVLLLANFIG